MPSTIDDALCAIRRGEPVVVTDDENRENEGDLIMAAEAARPETIAFFLRHTSGVICAALTGERADELALPLMVRDNREARGTAFTITVDAAAGISTGISASDRAHTLNILASPRSTALDLVRPGHVFPLRARDGGVLERPGHTEASVDLPRLAGLTPAGVLCEVVSGDHATMARRPELELLARDHRLHLVSVAQLVGHRIRHERLVQPIAEARIPTAHGEFTCHAWRSAIDGIEHLALVRGRVDDGGPVLTRVHSECLTGDVFGSRRCDCGSQLDDALAMVAEAGRGVVIYLRGHEGRGIGIGHKLEAYNLQDGGLDTLDANLELGLPADAREYGISAQILGDLGISGVRLLTNNPDKCEALRDAGIDVAERVSLIPRLTPDNLAYLRTKRERMGHLLPERLTAAQGGGRGSGS